MSVTDSRKRYVTTCAGCGGIHQAERTDAVTCSTRCRVRVHRHPELVADLHNAAAGFRITVSSILRARAVSALRPDLVVALEAGELEVDDVASDPETHAAYWRLVLRPAIEAELARRRSA